MGREGEKYTSEKVLARTRPRWKNTDISCTETPLCTSKTQTLKKKKTRVNAILKGYMKQVADGGKTSPMG